MTYSHLVACPPAGPRPRGFTLIELLIILALLAIFAAFAIPSFNQFVNNIRTESAKDELVALLQYARSTAVAQRNTVMVCTSDDAWEVKLGNCDSSTEPSRRMDRPSGTSISSDQDEISFRGNGIAGTAVSIQVCRNSDPANGFTVSVAAAGSIRSYGRGKVDASSNMSSCGAAAQPEEEENNG